MVVLVSSFSQVLHDQILTFLVALNDVFVSSEHFYPYPDDTDSRSYPTICMVLRQIQFPNHLSFAPNKLGVA